MKYNPYSVFNNDFSNEYSSPEAPFTGTEEMMKLFRQPFTPTGKQPSNPYSFTGQDQYGTFAGGGGDMTPIPLAPTPQQQNVIRSMNNVGMQNPTQQVQPTNPYASMFPTFNANDLTWADNYFTIGEGGNERTDRRPGQGTLNNVRNYYPEWGDNLSPNNYMFTQQNQEGGYDPNSMQLLVKTGEKEGTAVPYSLQNGQWVPNYEGRRTQRWDTNPGDQNRALAMMAAAAIAAPYVTQLVGGMGAAAPAVGGTVGQGLPASLGGIEGIIGGSTAAPSLSTGLGTGFAGVAPMTGTLPSIVPGAALGTGAAGIGTAASLSSLFPSVGSGLGPTVEAAAGLGGQSFGGATDLMGPPDFLAGSNVDPYGAGSGFGGDTLPAMGVPDDTGAGLLDRLSGLGNRVGSLASGAGRLFGGGGQGGVGGGGGGGLASLIAALYGTNAQSRYADQLNQFIGEMRANANPYMTRLQESYTNPQAYLQSPEMQARLGLEANRLTGIDASKGRLANDIQRTKLLQDYGMAGLNDYRTGLRNTVQNLWNPNQVFQAQAMMGAIDSAKYSDLARLLGQGTQGGFNVGNTVNDIKSIVDAGGDLWDYIKGWF